MENYHHKRGQVYAPSGQPEAAVARYVRSGRAGGKRVRIADAATGRREREVDVHRVNEFPRRNGFERQYPYTISSTSLGQDVSCGGFVRLEPEPAVEAVSILVATLEAAAWTVEPATTYPDELRVRYQGKNRCPSMYVAPGAGASAARGGVATPTSTRTTSPCTSDRTTHPRPPSWWMPGQRLTGIPARTPLGCKVQPAAAVIEPSPLQGDPSELHLRISYDGRLWDTPQADTLECWNVAILHRRRAQGGHHEPVSSSGCAADDCSSCTVEDVADRGRIAHWAMKKESEKLIFGRLRCCPERLNRHSEWPLHGNCARSPRMSSAGSPV